MDHFSTLLQRAACAAGAAADACRAWEDGGDPAPVADRAWEADGATFEALEAVASIDPTLIVGTYPETRLGRLVMAARLLVLAGTDEVGQSEDLDLASQALHLAMRAT